MTAPNYSTLIDAETWAFIRRSEDYYPPDAVGLTVADQRAIYDRMSRAFFAGYPAGVTAQDALAGAVPLRIYHAAAAPTATVVYFHGGGFVVGGLESHDDVCAEICAASGYRVVSVDYRLAPEFVHPAAYDDSLAATRHVLATYPGKIVLAGDSAGGNLAAAVAQALRGDARIVGQVLVYPGLGGDMTAGSYLTHAAAPMLTTADVMFYKDIRGGADGDVTASPLQTRDFTGLPPALVISAECDPLCDDGRVYVERLAAAGGAAEWVMEPGLVHGYLRARGSVRRAQASFARIVAGITRLGR